MALLSRGTRNGRQEQELRAAVGDSQGGRGPGKPLVLPCAVTGTRNAAFDDIAQDFLRQSHVLDFADFDVGWQRLYEWLYKAARLAGFWVPKLLRAVPRHDLDHAAVARMVVKQGFFSKAMNAGSGAEEAQLSLAPGGMVVDDRSSGRMWTRGCIDPSVLPKAPLSSADEEVASLTPAAQRSVQCSGGVHSSSLDSSPGGLAADSWRRGDRGFVVTRYLDCALPECGFARLRCDTCRAERLLLAEFGRWTRVTRMTPNNTLNWSARLAWALGANSHISLHRFPGMISGGGATICP